MNSTEPNPRTQPWQFAKKIAVLIGVAAAMISPALPDTMIGSPRTIAFAVGLAATAVAAAI